jgi:hypothetical protein
VARFLGITRGVEGWSACMYVHSMSQWLSQVSNCAIFPRFDLCQVGDGLVSCTCGFCYTVRLRKKKQPERHKTRQVGQTWIWIHSLPLGPISPAVAPSPIVRRRRQSESASQEQSRLGLSLARTLVTTGCNFAVFFFCLRRRQPIVGFGSHLRWGLCH